MDGPAALLLVAAAVENDPLGGAAGATVPPEVTNHVRRCRIAKVSLSGRITASGLTVHGKRAIAIAMYTKGKGFVGAAVLLSARGGYDAVVLHLLCQGLEIILKGLLLVRDYDHHLSRLQRPLGHNLDRIAREAAKVFLLKPLRPRLSDELNGLSSLYRQHLLRYASMFDIFVDARTVPRELVLKRTAAVVRLAERSLRAAGTGP